jgi:hypothetical protein
MDIYFSIKSLLNSGIDFKKINGIFNEPVNIIDNLFYSNKYNLNNYSIIRDYNFKNIILIIDSESKIDQINKFKNSDIEYHDININLNQASYKEIEDIVDMINTLQLVDNTESEMNNNIIIYSESFDLLYLIIMSLMIYKYNYSVKKSIRFIEKIFSLEKNSFKPNNQIKNILKQFI